MTAALAWVNCFVEQQFVLPCNVKMPTWMFFPFFTWSSKTVVSEAQPTPANHGKCTVLNSTSHSPEMGQQGCFGFAKTEVQGGE